MNKKPAREEAWFSNQEYPFKSHYLPLPEGRMHYVSEGKGEPVILIHGTPTWSFLYRKQIKALSKNFRVIAPDHLGYGLSDKPRHADYRPQAHAQRLEQLLQHLNLAPATLVVHDFGGPIGLSYALQHPDRIKRLVILNTWLWPLHDEKYAQQADRLLKSWLGKVLYRRFNFSPKLLLKAGFYNKKKLTKAIHHHYTRVFPSAADREAPYQMGLGLVGATDWYQNLWEQRQLLAPKPMLLLWGIKDPYLTEKFLEKWQQNFPQAQTQRLEAGHFIQEECAEELLIALQEFLAKEDTPAARV